MEQMLRQLSQCFPNDASAPSVCTAYLPDKELYYASIVRYREPFGQSKEVVANATGETLSQALTRAWLKFISATVEHV